MSHDKVARPEPKQIARDMVRTLEMARALIAQQLGHHVAAAPPDIGVLHYIEGIAVAQKHGLTAAIRIIREEIDEASW